MSQEPPRFIQGLRCETRRLSDLVKRAPQESGKVAMGDLARRFNLSSDLLLPVVTTRLGSAIRGRLEGGLLFTPAYIARIKV